MFDLAWSEIALILLVALVVIGPKELPNAARGVADFIRKARRMAAEFQVHVDEMMRETKLDEVKRQIDEVRTGIYDMTRDVERAVDDHGVRDAFKDPFLDSATPTPRAPAETAPPTAEPAEPPASAAPSPQIAAGPPPFVPPAFTSPGSVSPAAAARPAEAAQARDGG